MDLIKFSIEKPVTVIVGVIMIVMFGIIGFSGMPYQLSPTVTEPEITVQTVWTGATPYEIERDIIEEQEKVLKGVPGLIEMESSSFNNMGTITLKFKIGTNVDDALLRVSNKLNEVRRYPENSDRPVINASGSATSPVIWMIFKAKKNNKNHISTYVTYFENEIRQYIERVEGVSDLFVRGGRESEMHVSVNPEKLAAYNISIIELISVLRLENVNMSAGTMSLGRRNYRIRTMSEFKSEKDIEDIVIKSTGQQRVTVRDIAVVKKGYAKFEDAMMHNRLPGIAVGVKPEPGVNILDLTNRVEAVVKRLNKEKLHEKDIYLDWVYDQRKYIDGAINLVKKNILIGGCLAVFVLLAFLRSVSSTIVVAASIPISIVGTFALMNAFGRNLNVVSLAGISFAVGMLVDNAIVVLENIDRHRKMGKTPFEAAYTGTTEVWGAILASTITTVAVFLPIIFMEEEAGQLFRDIAIAVTCSVTLSLFVSVTVIPMFSKQLFSLSKGKKVSEKGVFFKIGNFPVNALMFFVKLVAMNWFTRIVSVVSLTAIAAFFCVFFFPKMEYLPQGNRNLIINILIPPPGLSYNERSDIGKFIFEESEPLMGKDYMGYPGVANMFYVGSESIMLFGAISKREQRAGELIPFFNRIINSIPGMFGISTQVGIFQSNLGRGRTINVDFKGDDMNSLVMVAGTTFGLVMQNILNAQVRPVPSLEVLYPEVRIVPKRDRLRSSGMTALDLGTVVDVLMDGRQIGDFKEEGKKKIDLVLKGDNDDITPEELYKTLISTPNSKVLPLSSVSTIKRTSGITQVRHLERKRTFTIQVTPPTGFSLEEAMEVIEEKVIPVLKEKGLLAGVDVSMSGAADKLIETKNILQWNFILALVITYLLMSALFGNFLYPLIIMLTVPLAAGGGFLGLKLVNLYVTKQPFDILTMLGFIILVGVVVNNAILIVHQSINNMKHYKMHYMEAVLDSTKTRIRPIFMSATTSIFGMLPLVLAPGPGSELYRGLGSVILGGLALSTIFTLFVIPAYLTFFLSIGNFLFHRQQNPGERN